MRLINARTLKFAEFYGDRIPKYAILSHTWEDDEATFQDWQDPESASRKAGYVKIKGACRRACRDNLDYVWVDTNCIDKSSSAELTEAINSMFTWYRNSAVCYAYLIDVPPATVGETYEHLLSHLRKSRWFTRGWTLQELLAPSRVIFFASDWARIGERASQFANDIAHIAGIDPPYLTGELPLAAACVATKMYWLSCRVTTRIEDIAYCMLGIFDINMPLLYGEGSKAFTRLQEEIIKVSNDHTIFCWTWTDSVPGDWVSLLAPSPETFRYSANFRHAKSTTKEISIYSMTNAGISICLPVIQSWCYYFVVLNAEYQDHTGYPQRACVRVSGMLDRRLNKGHSGLMQREAFPAEVLSLPLGWAITEQDLIIRSRINPMQQISIPTELSCKYGMLITVGNTKQLTAYGASAEVSQYWSSGNEVYLLETAAFVIRFSTYPPALFDESRSMFLFNYRIQDSVYGGFLRLGQDVYTPVSIVAFLAIKLVPRSRALWFCQILPADSWNSGEEGLRDLLRRLGEQVASRGEDQLYHASSESEANALITDKNVGSSPIFRVAHLFPGGTGLFGLGQHIHGAPKDVGGANNDDSWAPAGKHELADLY